ncbi:unnamed protein product, partial [Rotaria magnacalcarata]
SLNNKQEESAEEEESSEEEESEEDESSDDEKAMPTNPSTVAKPPPTTTTVNDYTIPAMEKSLLEMDLESFLGSTSTTTNVPVAPVKNNIFNDLHGLESLTSTSSTLVYTRQYDCLNRMIGQGLQIQYRFPRTTYRQSPNMVHVELIFTNTTTIKDIHSIKFLKP